MSLIGLLRAQQDGSPKWCTESAHALATVCRMHGEHANACRAVAEEHHASCKWIGPDSFLDLLQEKSADRKGDAAAQKRQRKKRRRAQEAAAAAHKKAFFVAAGIAADRALRLFPDELGEVPQEEVVVLQKAEADYPAEYATSAFQTGFAVGFNSSHAHAAFFDASAIKKAADCSGSALPNIAAVKAQVEMMVPRRANRVSVVATPKELGIWLGKSVFGQRDQPYQPAALVQGVSASAIANPNGGYPTLWINDGFSGVWKVNSQQISTPFCRHPFCSNPKDKVELIPAAVWSSRWVSGHRTHRAKGWFYYLKSQGGDDLELTNKEREMKSSVAVGSTDGWVWNGKHSHYKHASHGFLPQVMDTVPLASGGLLLATRRLKYFCAKENGTSCKSGKNGTIMSYTDASMKAWVYYIETVDATSSQKIADRTPELFTPAVKTNWTAAAAHLSMGPETDLEGNPVLFEAKCGLPYYVTGPIDKTRAGKLNDEVKRRGEDNAIPPEVSCPTMAIAADKEHIYVLGAFDWPRSAEVRMYERVSAKKEVSMDELSVMGKGTEERRAGEGSSRQHWRHTKTFMRNLCKTGQTDRKDDWHVYGKENEFKTSDGPTPAFDELQSFYQGGSLALDLDEETGTARYVYGLALCGCLFRIEPSTGKQELLGFPCTYQDLNRNRWNMFTGLAIQKYRVAGNDVEHVQIAVTVLEQPDQGFAWMGPLDRGKASIYLLGLEDLLAQSKDITYQESTQTWTFPKRALGACFLKKDDKGKDAHEPILRTVNARKIAYADGFLYWYGGLLNQLRRIDIRMSIPCPTITSNPVIRNMMASWEGTANVDATKSSSWLDVQLLEDGIKGPSNWIIQFKLKTEVNDSSRLAKYIVCSKPKPPTTRPSMQSCCVWKVAEITNKTQWKNASRCLEHNLVLL